MSSLDQFDIAGPADPVRVRIAGLLDALAAAIVAMLAVPQPFVRGAIMGDEVTAMGIATFVLALFAAIFLVFGIYLAFSAVMWGRTPVMYLFDLGLDTPTKPTMREALTWSAAWVLATLPALIGVQRAYHPETGWPARFSGAPTRSTASATPAHDRKDD